MHTSGIDLYWTVWRFSLRQWNRAQSPYLKLLSPYLNQVNVFELKNYFNYFFNEISLLLIYWENQLWNSDTDYNAIFYTQNATTMYLLCNTFMRGMRPPHPPQHSWLKFSFSFFCHVGICLCRSLLVNSKITSKRKDDNYGINLLS